MNSKILTTTVIALLVAFIDLIGSSHHQVAAFSMLPCSQRILKVKFSTVALRENIRDNFMDFEVSNRTMTSIGEDEEDIVSSTTKGFLETVGPQDFFNFELDDDDEGYVEDDKIFNPMSFWTERSGRYHPLEERDHDI
jgi:tRNA A-37 threonylcarbamoyl transferase component Bud32